MKKYTDSGTRKCYVCKEVKSINDFTKNKSRTSGYDYDCKSCHAISARSTRPLIMGISRAELDALTVTQNNKCAICGNAPSNKRRLAIDHDHTTGKVRGLLCNRCNLALGHIESVLEYLPTIKKYLAR